eukprot:gene10155-7110_t
MDLLSVLDQRHRDQSSEVRLAKNSFWCSIIWTFSFVLLVFLTAPALHPLRDGTISGLFLSQIFLMAQAGMYISMMQGIHSLTALRLPSSYAGSGLHSQLRFLLPNEHGRARGATEYVFYASFVLSCVFGFSFQSSIIFVAALMVFCGSYILHVFPYYGLVLSGTAHCCYLFSLSFASGLSTGGSSEVHYILLEKKQGSKGVIAEVRKGQFTPFSLLLLFTQFFSKREELHFGCPPLCIFPVRSYRFVAVRYIYIYIHRTTRHAREREIEIGFNLYKMDAKHPRPRPSSLPPVAQFQRPSALPSAHSSTRMPNPRRVGSHDGHAARATSLDKKRTASNPPTPSGSGRTLVPAPPPQQRLGAPSRPVLAPAPPVSRPPLSEATACAETTRAVLTSSLPVEDVALATPSDSPLSSSSPPTTTPLEDTLNYLLSVDEQLLSLDAVAGLTLVTKALKHDRRARHGQQPFRKLALLDTEKDPGMQRLLFCLAQAAQAQTLEQVAACLDEVVNDEGGNERLRSAMCLIHACWAETQLELLLRSPLDGPRASLIRDRSFSLLDGAIAAGHVGAMFYIGCCLRDGRGISMDLDAGVNWIDRAASAGYTPAIHEMGEMLEHGVEREGMELDADWGEAMEWYTKAAERNYIISQLNLGKLLLTASMHCGAAKMSEDERDELVSKALDWLDVAAASGNEEALRLRERV